MLKILWPFQNIWTLPRILPNIGSLFALNHRVCWRSGIQSWIAWARGHRGVVTRHIFHKIWPVLTFKKEEFSFTKVRSPTCLSVSGFSSNDFCLSWMIKNESISTFMTFQKLCLNTFVGTYLCTTYIVSIENSLTLIWTEAKNQKENTQKIITIFKKTKYKCIHSRTWW